MPNPLDFIDQLPASAIEEFKHWCIFEWGLPPTALSLREANLASFALEVEASTTYQALATNCAAALKAVRDNLKPYYATSVLYTEFDRDRQIVFSLLLRAEMSLDCLEVAARLSYDANYMVYVQPRLIVIASNTGRAAGEEHKAISTKIRDKLMALSQKYGLVFDKEIKVTLYHFGFINQLPESALEEFKQWCIFEWGKPQIAMLLRSTNLENFAQQLALAKTFEEVEERCEAVRQHIHLSKFDRIFAERDFSLMRVDEYARELSLAAHLAYDKESIVHFDGLESWLLKLAESAGSSATTSDRNTREIYITQLKNIAQKHGFILEE